MHPTRMSETVGHGLYLFSIHVYPELSLEICIFLEITDTGLCHRTEDEAEQEIVLASLSLKNGET